MSNQILIIINPQNDFVTGSMSNNRCEEIVPNITKMIHEAATYEDHVFVVLDTHTQHYLNTPEGRNNKVKHCIVRTTGWEIDSDIKDALNEIPNIKMHNIQKQTFGSIDLVKSVKDTVKSSKDTIRNINIVGYHTDVDVLSNAILLKANFKDITITVVEYACAAGSSDKHGAALEIFRSNHINVRVK